MKAKSVDEYWQRTTQRTLQRAGIVIFLIVFFVVIDSTFGPFLPVDPDFTPERPLGGTPLSIPVVVTNHSLLFSITGLTFSCHLIFAKAVRRESVADARVATPAADGPIRPHKSLTYLCPFRDLSQLDSIGTARIRLEGTYSSPWHLFGKPQAASPIFTWEPASRQPHWTPGIQIQD